ILSDKLTVNSGTFELANGSLQASLISIVGGLFLVDSGAIISAPVINKGTVEVAGGTLELAGGVSGTATLNINAAAAVPIDGTADSLNVAFAGSTGTLSLKDPANFTITISGLTGSDAIDLANIDLSQNAKAEFVGYDPIKNISTLIISDNQTIDTIYLVGDYSHSTWKLSSDGSGGTIVVDPITMVASGDTQILNDPTTSGLNGTDRIDLAKIDWETAQISNVSYSASTNITTLVITDGTHTDIVRLMGDYTGSSWTFSSDGSGGAIMVDAITTVVALDTSTDSAPITTEESSSVSSDLSASIASEDSIFSAFSRGSVWHAAWTMGHHDADMQFFDAPGHAAWQGLLEFPSVFAALDQVSPLSPLVPFINAASSTAASASDQFRFTDTNAGWHGSNPHTVEVLSQAAAQVAPDPGPGNPHDDQSDSLPPTAALDQSSDNQGPQGEAFGFGHSEGRSASAEDQNSNFDGPPGQALEHALETGRGNRGDDNAGQSATHEATNGHHHSEGTNA